MGILGKLLNAAGTFVEVGVDAVASTANKLSLKNKLKEQLEKLDYSWRLNCDEYEEKAASLEKRVNKGDRKAYDQLEELKADFEREEYSYKRERESILAKLQAGTQDNNKEKINRIEDSAQKKDYTGNNTKKEEFVTMPSKNVVDIIICNHCGNENGGAAKFCCGCGQVLNTKKFCVNCGTQIDGNAQFCSGCGSKVGGVLSIPVVQQPDKTQQRKQFFDGEIHKCPQCGEVLNSFSSNCPVCGYELRGVTTANSIQEFIEKIDNCPSEKRLIELIRNFPIPNTKEDILEFMILASSNFDAKYYNAHLKEEDVSDAWLAKIEQCYKKAKSTLSQQDLQKIENIYNEVKDKINPLNKVSRLMKNWIKK